MENAEDRQVVYYFRNGFSENCRNMYGWLRHYNLNPKIGVHEIDENGASVETITLPVDQVSCLRKMQDYNPALFGTNPANWSSRPDGRPDRVPENGLYWFRAHGGDKKRICEVTDKRVKFQNNPKGVPHEFLGHAVIFEPLSLSDFPQKITEVFVISFNDGPAVAIPRHENEVFPMPSQIVEAYCNEHSMERSKLTWIYAPIIPLPTVSGFNDQD